MIPHVFLLLYSSTVIVRWKNTLFLGIDACFKLKLKERGFNDPDLCAGLAYMVNEDQYQAYLDANVGVTELVFSFPLFSLPINRSSHHCDQVTTCGPDLNAVNQAYTKSSQGYAVTGVAAVSCRHAFVRPKGVLDLQKGEK